MNFRYWNNILIDNRRSSVMSWIKTTWLFYRRKYKNSCFPGRSIFIFSLYSGTHVSIRHATCIRFQYLDARMIYPQIFKPLTIFHAFPSDMTSHSPVIVSNMCNMIQHTVYAISSRERARAALSRDQYRTLQHPHNILRLRFLIVFKELCEMACCSRKSWESSSRIAVGLPLFVLLELCSGN